MGHKCTVPADLKTNKQGNPYYTKCGLDANYQVGSWYMCKGHKKYLADVKKWPAKLLEEA